jgi:hypothetical protein
LEHTTPEGEAEVDRCQCPEKKSVPFLDTSLLIENGQIVVDLYRKPSDRNKYLLLDSCHPEVQKNNIPFSLFLRITRICSKESAREIRYNELKGMLLERKYPIGMIESAMKRARAIPRKEALKPVANPTPTSRRPIFVVTWDPRLPNLPAIGQKHWRSMTATDPYLAEVFPAPPLVAYKRQKNIRDFLVRAKVPPPLAARPRRVIPGMRRCQKQCHACPYIKETKDIKTDTFKWKINKSVTCEDYNVVYMIECTKDNCKQKYVGETERKFKERLSDHKRYINNNNLQQPIGRHFNLPGHSIDDMRATILDKLMNKSTQYRKQREIYLIRKFNTFYSGMNRTPGG